MAVKYFCDACGTEVSGPTMLREMGVFGRHRMRGGAMRQELRRWQVCPDCELEIREVSKEP